MKETYILWFNDSKVVLVLIFINKILILSFIVSRRILWAEEKDIGLCHWSALLVWKDHEEATYVLSSVGHVHGTIKTESVNPRMTHL